MPEAEVIQALIAGDSERFYEVETENRRRANAAPFGRFAAIIVSSEDADEAAVVARLIGQSAPLTAGMRVYGPAPAALSVLRGRPRHRLPIRTAPHVSVPWGHTHCQWKR